MNALNFLKFQPLTNWLDYFLDRSKYFDLIKNVEKNEATMGQLLDQFIEQALGAEREHAQLQIKDIDEEDVLYMRHKVDELWMCALCTLAAMHWDLNFILQHSNVLRTRALWNQLCFWVFSEKIYEQCIGEDVFSKIVSLHDLSSLNSEQIFTLWLYARWVLLVDVRARFPQPAPKPTVSNPQNQVDQNLLNVEKLNQITCDVRQNVSTAVNLLNQFLGVSNGNALKAYGPECFYVALETITANSLHVLKNPAKPNFAAKCLGMSRIGFQTKTIISLLSAHFAARHFRSAKTLHEKAKANLQKLNEKPEKTPYLQQLLRIDESELSAYEKALDFTKSVPPKSDDVKTQNPDEMHAKCIVEAALLRRTPSPKTLLSMLTNGYCVSKRFLHYLLEPNFRMHFLEEVSKQFWSLEFVPGANDRDNKKRLHVYCALYFFCLISPNFADTLFTHPRLKTLRKWRGLATTVETPLAAQPMNSEIKYFLSNETPLWNVMVSFDLEVIKSGLNRLQNNFKLPFRHRFSDVIGGKVLNRAGRIYNQVVLHLWKLEQLGSLNNTTKWKEFINGFVTKVVQQISTPEIQELMAFDLIRAETDILNRQLFKTVNLAEYKLRNIEHFNLMSCSMRMVVPKNSDVFTRFALSMSVFLLNNRHYQVIALTEHPCFKSSFTDLARNLATYFLRMFEMRDVVGAKNSLVVFWTSMWPTFEIYNSTRRQGVLLLTKHQFLDFIAYLKEPNMLDFFFSFFAHLINGFLVYADAEREKSLPPGQFATPLQAAYFANWRICAPSENIWQQMTFDAKSVDIDFVKTALEVLCRNAMIVNPINVHWLRIYGDLCFLSENYGRAVTFYLEIVVTVVDKLGTIEISDEEMDTIFTKIAVACVALRMPTLAVIVGQLRTNMAVHYPQVEWMLQNTPNTVDAGHAYFPLIADITLVEHMTAAYNKFGLTIYANKLLKNMPTRAINPNNSPKVLNYEVERRKKCFFDVLLNHFFSQNVS